MSAEGFDRIRAPGSRSGGAAPPDGRAARFSVGDDRRVPGCGMGLALRCSRCDATTPLDAGVALRAALPVFLVLPWRRDPVFALCPACGRRSWLRLTGGGERQP